MTETRQSGTPPPWAPLRMTYHVRTYSFGERLIPEMLGKENLPEGVVAETWEISDQKDTRATITSGHFAGQLLHDVVLAHPDDVVGEGWRGPHFPILDKFLDASHPLPVHLHADNETARIIHGEPHGKSEAWHILYAAPGATILAGIRPGFSRAELFQAFLDQDYDRVMFRYPIAAGDTVYVPGGILHAFGPDTLIFEVQQTSDLGQSVMPTDLYGQRHSDEQWRANIEATLNELKTHFLPKPNAGLDKPAPEPGNRFTVGCAGPYFALERWRLSAPHRDAVQRGRSGDRPLVRRRGNARPRRVASPPRRHRRRHDLPQRGHRRSRRLLSARSGARHRGAPARRRPQRRRHPVAGRGHDLNVRGRIAGTGIEAFARTTALRRL